jgi:predicted membrane-bound dolichyl-phosphate-mannose-protein mannosyltransferase
MNSIIKEQSLVINLVLDQTLRKKFFKNSSKEIINFFNCNQDLVSLNKFDIEHQARSTKGLMLAEITENLSPIDKYVNLDYMYDEYTRVYPSKLVVKIEEYLRFISYIYYKLLTETDTVPSICFDILNLYNAIFQSTLLKVRYGSIFKNIKKESLVEFKIQSDILEVLGEKKFTNKKNIKTVQVYYNNSSQEECCIRILD